MNVIDDLSGTCAGCQALLAEAEGAPRTPAMQEAIDSRPEHIIRPVDGNGTEIPEGLEDAYRQAELDYAPVHQAYVNGDADREELWAKWLEKHGDRFTAVCHDVMVAPLGA